MKKSEIINGVLDRFMPARVLEIGRIRSTQSCNEIGDGWSTLQFARHKAVKVLVSVDNDPRTLQVCAQFPELRADNRIMFRSSVDEVHRSAFDLVYLDAEEDDEATVGHFRSIEGLLAEGAVVLMDDVYEGIKGDLLIPMLEKEGWTIEELGPMALATRKVVENADQV